MAGYSRIYCVGEPGGYEGADGITSIRTQIWVGEGNRQWLEGHAFRPDVRRLGDVRRIVPAAPDHPDALLDACLCFAADLFEACPSLAAVREQLAGVEMLDFDLGIDEIPPAWERLREEARPVFARLCLYEAELRPRVRHA